MILVLCVHHIQLQNFLNAPRSLILEREWPHIVWVIGGGVRLVYSFKFIILLEGQKTA